MELTCDVSVVIVNWNTREMLRDCLHSVFEQSADITIEVIVIDNASTDQSQQMVRSEFSEVVLIANEDNRGFAAANNQGIAISTGRYVLLLNSDTLILDKAITRTVEFADQSQPLGVVGCQVWENELTIQKTCFRFHTPWNILCVLTGLARVFPRSRVFGGDKMLYWDRTTSMDVEVVSGMFMLVRREAIDDVGLLDEKYFIYCEEADWCYRIHQAGWRSHFWSGARIVHREGGGKSTSQVNVQMEIFKVKSLLYYIQKNVGFLAEIKLRCLMVLVSTVKILILIPAILFAPSYSTNRIRKFSGIVRFCLRGV